MKKPDLSKSLTQLEQHDWGSVPADASRLVTRCLSLRHKPVKDMKADDLRVLIGQSIGLPYLLPIALTLLYEDPFVEAEYFSGDLLCRVLDADPAIYREHADLRVLAESVIATAQHVLTWLDDAGIVRREFEKALQSYRAGQSS